MKFVALLRGVNVNGIKITNQALKVSMAEIDLGVIPVLQTGNMIFDSTLPMDQLKIMIENQLSKSFHYEAFIILMTAEALKKVLQLYPFTLSDEMQPYVIFSNDTSILNELSHHEFDSTIEQLKLSDDYLFWTVKKRLTLDSPFGKCLGKAKYKPFMTSRNLRTIEKIIQKLD
ncbi:DUF1697 domain-containing protein [Macrococcus sp. DPC7161]|uniref:DUF1697 domain-containing protein n=1 Tax=Macrococcus sp. DPC7161 TaxID=2507060 RepID=UPI00100BDBB0|nr:DUF1697 domain-containing protein [Macrococcus sp. DPC7161]RXK17940.1 DUF1697 domain-containing protein [Macrococcus sp. DPC7161]